jgi:hypothetical protein
MFGNGVDVEVGLSHHEFFLAGAAGGGIPVGQRPHGIYDYFSVTSYNTPWVQEPPPQPVGTWDVDIDGGTFTNDANWDLVELGGNPGQTGGGNPPTNTHHAIMGPVITAPRFVNVNANITLKRLTFDNANTYALGGGSRLTMSADSGNATVESLQGSHLIQVPVTLSSPTTLTASAGARLDFNNEFNINAQMVDVTGAGKVFINNNLDGAGAAGIVNNTGNLGGSGRIDGALNNNSGGTLNPGSSVGTLTVAGAFTQVDGASINIELGDTSTSGIFDKIVVTGAATLDGSIFACPIGSFATVVGNVYTILTATGGVTNNTLALAASDTGKYSLGFTANSVTLTVLVSESAGLAGDYNDDGTINAADYTVYRNCKSGVGGCTVLPNDPTPGSITISDYQYWKDNYGATGAGSGSGLGSGSVPEPSSIALLLIAALGACGLVRQR